MDRHVRIAIERRLDGRRIVRRGVIGRGGRHAGDVHNRAGAGIPNRHGEGRGNCAGGVGRHDAKRRTGRPSCTPPVFETNASQIGMASFTTTPAASDGPVVVCVRSCRSDCCPATIDAGPVLVRPRSARAVMGSLSVAVAEVRLVRPAGGTTCAEFTRTPVAAGQGRSRGDEDNRGADWHGHRRVDRTAARRRGTRRRPCRCRSM